MNLPSSHAVLRRMLESRVAQAAPRRAPLAASLGRNAAGGTHLTLKRNGRTMTVYVPRELTDAVLSSIQEHKRLKTLLAEMTQIQLALLRGHTARRRLKKGRP